MTNLLNCLRKNIDNKSVNLFISGGNSPRNFLIGLSKKKTLLKKIEIFLTDERLIIGNKDYSNYQNINSLFKDNKLTKKINTFTKKSLKNKQHFISYLKNRKIISIIGIGNDGHFASIFPFSKKNKFLLDKRANPNFFTTEKIGKPYCNRITMNLSMILKSKKVYIIINTRRKLKVLKKAIRARDSIKYPIYSLYKNAKKKLSIFDAKTLKEIKTL